MKMKLHPVTGNPYVDINKQDCQEGDEFFIGLTAKFVEGRLELAGGFVKPKDRPTKAKKKKDEDKEKSKVMTTEKKGKVEY